MTNLLILLVGSLILAHASEKRIAAVRLTHRSTLDIPLIVMLVWLCLFCGLRTAYNDTTVYISSFEHAPTLDVLLGKEINLLGNPLYYIFESFFHHSISSDFHLFLMTIAVFNIISAVRFIRRHTTWFTFSMLLFFTIGMYVANFAAMKQSIAMAILTYAIDKLLDKKYIRFYLIVVLAGLFHTYALMYAVLPLFMNRPWTKITYITIGVMLFVLFTFESTITEFLEYADELGKDIAETEVFETASINIFRLAVFFVPVLLSFIFQGRLTRNMPPLMCLMANMSILSFLVMCLGLNSAANLFSRCAIYFEMGTIIILPWLIDRLFTKESARLMCQIATLCYTAFFIYDMRSFVLEYRAIDFSEFLRILLGG